MEILRIVADLVILDAMHVAIVATLGAALVVLGSLACVMEGWSSRAELCVVPGVVLVVAAMAGAQHGGSVLAGMLWVATVLVALYAAAAWLVHWATAPAEA